ncbi:hypothetical protein [Pseudorhodoplanes sp.]|uniref:hypothetical protein n=1 Tax=Pseudorhodoplanes sp. TaxID=1934341 RepID=UPI003D0E5037
MVRRLTVTGIRFGTRVVEPLVGGVHGNDPSPIVPRNQGKWQLLQVLGTGDAARAAGDRMMEVHAFSTAALRLIANAI